MSTTGLPGAPPVPPPRSRRRRRLAASAAAVLALVALASGCINNGTWTATALSTAPASSSATVTDVSCEDAYWCMAVGSTGFVETWDGTAWAAGTRPPVADQWGAIEDVDCGRVDACLAVVVREVAPVPERHLLGWNGSTWTDVLGHSLDVVAETTTFSCVGDGQCLILDPVSDATVVWDGSASTSTPFGVTQPPTDLLSCSSTADCLAVSSGGWATSWNGVSWAPVIEAAAWQPTALSCAASTAETCAAIGHDIAGTASISARWTGQEWVFSSVPSTGSTTWTSISCVSGSECIAVGLPAGPGAEPTQVGFVTDTWFRLTAPPGGADAQYGAVSCSQQWCMAVGQDQTPTHQLLAATYTWSYP